MSAQERQNAVVINTLEAELNEANEDKDHDIRLKNDVIRKLQVYHQIKYLASIVPTKDFD